MNQTYSKVNENVYVSIYFVNDLGVIDLLSYPKIEII
jgi:hypothetical protein